MTAPLAIDLFCGLGGWSEGLLSQGYRVVGFDNERHQYGEHRYPGQLVIQDVRTLHGSQFADAALIVASPPCTEYSYMAMPWTRAKQIARALRGRGEFPEGYTGSRTLAELNELFDACFRIQREASEAAGRHVPLVVENVCGAQKWVGRAAWHYGSFYLWGDVPALMPVAQRHAVIKNTGGSWFSIAHNTTSGKGRNPDGRNDPRDAGVKNGGDWFDAKSPSMQRRGSHGSKRRKAASALIAKIPFTLAKYIAAVYRDGQEVTR